MIYPANNNQLFLYMKKVREKIEQVLDKIRKENPGRNFVEAKTLLSMGFDYIEILALIQILERDFGISMPNIKKFQSMTVNQLADVVIEKYVTVSKIKNIVLDAIKVISGVEIPSETMEKTSLSFLDIEYQDLNTLECEIEYSILEKFDCSPAISLQEMYTGLTFNELVKAVTIKTRQSMS